MEEGRGTPGVTGNRRRDREPPFALDKMKS
jgi:hypothetical protein